MIKIYNLSAIPGGGKTTHGKLLQEKNPELYIHISTGRDVFGSIKRKGTNKTLIAQMNEWDKNGALYPDEFTAKELDNYINERISNKTFNPEKQVIILDGYPRNLTQTGLMEGKYSLEKIAFIYIPPSVGLERILKRSKTEKRTEDENIITVTNRIEEHERNIRHVLWHYTQLSHGPEIKYILGMQTKERVYDTIDTFFKK